MTTYILRRLLLMIPTLLGITVVVFTVMAASPGGITSQSLIEGQDLEPAAKQALADYYNQRYGLDQPAPLQYLRWLNNVSPIGFEFDRNGDVAGFVLIKEPDLGESFRYGRPVLDLIVERVPITLLLNLLSIPLIYGVAIAVGVHAATERGGSFDVTSSVVMLALWSIPTMLAGVLFVGFFASDRYWHLFPTGGLSQREALDMPFLPQWSSLGDGVTLLLLALGGVLLLAWLAQRERALQRAGAMALIGAALGAVAAHALPGESGLPLLVGLVLSFALLFAVIALIDFPALRTLAMALIGMQLGIALAFTFIQEGFVRGFLLDRLWHLLLPVITLAYGSLAFLSKLARSAVLENLMSDYARTARAKGVAEREVLWGHVFRNSLLPLITVAASLLPALLAGSVIVETIFSIDGMGKLAVEAVKNRDRELVLSVTLISGLLTLLGYLLADILYAIADPRVSYD